jgi:SAM-dependent methyltransferase
MRLPSAGEIGNMNNLTDISAFFDELYGNTDRYWWRDKDPYATNASSYPTSLLTQLTLRVLADRSPGRALDLGAGEGADAIRLARLGYTVEAVEISKVGADKISMFAEQAGVPVRVDVADLASYEPDGHFDVIICNGVLHYIAGKQSVIERMQQATRRGGINVISLWSTYSPVPDCHSRVPVYCDPEDGIVSQLYQDWIKEFRYFDRNKPEASHGGMPEHSHSHIKMIARKP